MSSLGRFKQGVSKQGVTTFAWRPGWQYDVAVTWGADSVPASDYRVQFGPLSTRRGCRICATGRLLGRPRRETMYWQANANTPPLRYSHHKMCPIRMTGSLKTFRTSYTAIPAGPTPPTPIRIIIRGVPLQGGGTGLDLYQICIQARFDTSQFPILI